MLDLVLFNPSLNVDEQGLIFLSSTLSLFRLIWCLCGVCLSVSMWESVGMCMWYVSICVFVWVYTDLHVCAVVVRKNKGRHRVKINR